LRHPDELFFSRRRNELDAVRDGDVRLGARHQRKPALDSKAGREQRRFDLGSGRGDVLEPRLSFARAIGGDECLYVGGRGDAAVSRDCVIEVRVVRVLREGREERADACGLASPRGLMTKRVLDPA
jgi:hypothetical protein